LVAVWSRGCRFSYQSDHTDIVTADSCADALERLFATYENRHTFAVIEDVLTDCRAQLAGQTPPGALLELLDRLTRQRLDDLPPTRQDR
jgi:hypothetical protein